MILRPNTRTTPLRRPPVSPLVRAPVHRPQIRLLLRLLPHSRVVIPRVRAADRHARVKLAVERLERVEPARASEGFLGGGRHG